jgi:hypothetical protein
MKMPSSVYTYLELVEMLRASRMRLTESLRLLRPEYRFYGMAERQRDFDPAGLTPKSVDTETLSIDTAPTTAEN